MAEQFRAERGKIIVKGSDDPVTGDLLLGGPGELRWTIAEARKHHDTMQREQGAGDPLGAAIRQAKFQRLMFWRRD